MRRPGVMTLRLRGEGEVKQAQSGLALARFLEGISALEDCRTEPVPDRRQEPAGTGRVETRLDEIRRVKTIWQAERALDITEFFYPLKVMRVHNRPTSLRDFGRTRRVVIRGRVGQGKSILLRYLASQEIQAEGCLPVFIQLRCLSSTLGLERAVVEEIGNFGLPSTVSYFSALATNQKVALFLDGFDEVGALSLADANRYIDAICVRYPSLPIVISTRPGTGIVYSPHFDVLDLADLEFADVPGLMRRLAFNAADVDAVVASIEASETRLKDVLRTPLLVALLLIRYRITNSLPENEVEFYKNLLELLLSRHDQTKAGYRRERLSTLSDSQLSLTFEAFAFVTRNERLSAFQRRSAENMVADALVQVGLTACPEAVLNDIISATQLIVEDGGLLHFIHRSVQEFHSAAFISWLPAVNRVQLYEQLRTSWPHWVEELYFLRLLDPRTFAHHFILPDIQSFLRVSAGELLEYDVDQRSVKDILSRLQLECYRPGTGQIRVCNVRAGASNGMYAASQLFDGEFVAAIQRSIAIEYDLRLVERGIPPASGHGDVVVPGSFLLTSTRSIDYWVRELEAPLMRLRDYALREATAALEEEERLGRLIVRSASRRGQ